jgi:hypothetical protein
MLAAAAAADVRSEVDRILVEEATADLDVFELAVEALARSVASVFGLEVEAAWLLAFNALTDEFLSDLDS